MYQTEDGKLKIDVRFVGETVWLTQGQMADPFQTTQQNVSLNLQNVCAEGELEREATHKESWLVRQEGDSGQAANTRGYTASKISLGAT